MGVACKSWVRWQHPPDPRRLIFRGGHDAAPVGAERRAPERALVADQGPQLLAALGIPNPRCLVPRGGDDMAPVGAEGCAQEGAKSLTICHSPVEAGTSPTELWQRGPYEALPGGCT